MPDHHPEAFKDWGKSTPMGFDCEHENVETWRDPFTYENTRIRIRAWIDAKEHRPVMAAIAITEVPVIAGIWVIAVVVGAPWWAMPVALAAAVLTIGWIFLVAAVLT